VSQFFHVERIREWGVHHPNEHVSAAVQGRVSGETWRQMSDEQKAPYIRMAELDKEKHTIEMRRYEERKKRRRESEEGSHHEDHTHGVKVEEEEEEGEEEKVEEQQEVVEWKSNEGEEASELISPILSSRSLPSREKERVAEEEEGDEEKQEHSVSSLVMEEEPRPLSAYQLYLRRGMKLKQQEADQTRRKLRKGIATQVDCLHHPLSRCRWSVC
jgi:hypothetical protein